MKLHQAFSIAMPLEQKITEGVGWSELDSETNFLARKKLGTREDIKSIKKEAIIDVELMYYFPIDQSYKKIIMVKAELGDVNDGKIEKSNFIQNVSDGILGNWLESCNILLGSMLTKVEQEVFDQSQLNLFSPLKTVPINFKLSEFEFFGARIWNHFEISIPTSFFLWELQKEKYHHLFTQRSVYDLDNR